MSRESEGGENDVPYVELNCGDGTSSEAPASNMAAVDEACDGPQLQAVGWTASEDGADADQAGRPADADQVDQLSTSADDRVGELRARPSGALSVTPPANFRKLVEEDADQASTSADDQVGELRAMPSGVLSVTPPASFRKLVEEGVAEQCRRRIQDIYRRHRPEKLSALEPLMAQHRGSECELYAEVCAKYGVRPEPALLIAPPFASEASEPVSTVQYYRQRIEAVYRAAAPSKLCDVDDLMEAYRGREAELLNLVWSRHCDVLQGTLGRMNSTALNDGDSSNGTDHVVASQASAESRDALWYKDRISAIYSALGSDKLRDLDRLLSHHAGRERELYLSVCAKYDVTPETSMQSPAGSLEIAPERSASLNAVDANLRRLYRERIVAVYTKAKPEKLQDVDRLLRQHEGREYETYTNVCAKYGVDPEPEIKLCSRCGGRGRRGLCGLRVACLLSRQCPSCRGDGCEKIKSVVRVWESVSTGTVPIEPSQISKSSRKKSFPTPF